jgi:tRNA (cytosine34-C5)-methyltransferase
MEVAAAEGQGQEENSEATPRIDDLKGLDKCLALGMTQYHTYSEIPVDLQRKYKEFIFPPTAEEASWMHLERCLRCLPQDEDTGGFFVCAMRRLPPPQLADLVNQSSVSAPDPVPAPTEGEEEEGKESPEGDQTEEKTTKDDPASASTPAAPVPRPRGYGAGRATVDLKQWDSDSFQRIQEYFGLVEMNGQEFYIREDYTDTKQRKEFDSGLKDSSSSKSIYYLPSVARSIMNGDIYKRLKIVSAGIKVFERCGKGTFAGGGDCGYRLLQEGVDVIAPFVTKRKISVTIQDLCNFMEGGLVSFSTLSRETVTKLQQIQTGSVLAYYDFKPEDVLPPVPAADTEGDDSATSATAPAADRLKTHRLHVVCWRGANPTLNIMCSKLGTFAPSLPSSRPSSPIE